jgi:hypothetical protein
VGYNCNSQSCNISKDNTLWSNEKKTFRLTFRCPSFRVLAFKTATYNENNNIPSLLEFGANALVSYIAALAVNKVSRWTSMISAETARFLFQGIRVVSFLDVIVLMPLAVVLVIIGAVRLIQQKNVSAMVWIGVSLVTVGLNYSIYVIYSYFTNSLKSLPLVDVWTIHLLGLGISH